MAFVYITILVIGGVLWIIGQITDTINENSEKSKLLSKRKKEFLEKFGNRNVDKSKSLTDRNVDIINTYLVKIRKPEYGDRYYIANKVRDCINDIMLAEGENDGYPGTNYLSTWRNYANGEYGELSDFLLKLFKKRQADLAKEIEEEEKREKIILKIRSEISLLKEVKDDFGVFEKQLFEEIEKHKKGLQMFLSKKDIPLRRDNSQRQGIKKMITTEIVSQILSQKLKTFSFEDIYEDFSSNIEILERFKLKRNRVNSMFESIDITFLNKKGREDFANLQQSIESLFSKLEEYLLQKVSEIKLLINEASKNRNSYLAQMQDKLKKQDKDIVELLSRSIISSLGIDPFFQEIVLEYREDARILVINYKFVDLDNFPNLKEEKLYKNGTKKDIPLSQKIFEETYDNYITAVSIRVMYELFMRIDGISLISFNGWVHTINKGTGNDEDLFIMSIQTKREDCLSVNLANINPKIAFRGLKGISASKLSSLTPINPILKIDTSDHRFVDGYSVIEGMDSKQNLAAMDWQDFENLIRELFGKEFGKNGGEVKVTQASRDGGVDAIAFDPDPIRGGKIVIQAKRYTNTVDVSAVRDLHGTVQHEGANKGILVTTSTFGADSYEFIKNKPLTLINGGELLYLLEKHGYSAKINLREAKKILNLKQK